MGFDDVSRVCVCECMACTNCTGRLVMVWKLALGIAVLNTT